jgi:hypothetical protein
LVDELFDAVADMRVDHLFEMRPHLGPLPVADGLDQKVPKRPAGHGLAEHVEDLAAERLALLVELVEQ